ncbi:MAG: EscU/YscU/HrcU family type III secretion system export apparatus switch protein [Micavibrio sp.]
MDDDPLIPLNINKKPAKQVAVAIQDAKSAEALPSISAAGRGRIAEQILQLAFANGIRVRQDSALAEMLAALELDSPVPNEALVAVAEILSYVYRANGAPNPFDAPPGDVMHNPEQNQDS